MKNLEDIFQRLGINNQNGLYRNDDTAWKSGLQFSGRISRFLEKTNPYAFFCLDNKPMVLFFENPQEKKNLHRQIWNFNETPIVIIVENGIVEIFNGFKLLETKNEKGFLARIGGHEKLDDFAYFELVTGKTWETYQNELTYKNRVDYKLLTNIKDARDRIIGKFPKSNNDDEKKFYTKITNALLGKVIFIRYLIDRNVIIEFEGQSKVWTNSEFCGLLENPKRTKQFFDYLTDPATGFNGDLFPVTDNEYEIIPKEA